MRPKEWIRVKSVLEQALDRPESERSSFLTGACEGDELLRKEVESLLEAEQKDWSFFDTPPSWPSLALPEPVAAHRIGERVGPYEILGEIGRGGMGEVYLAGRADDEFQKKVAVKLVRIGMTGAEVLQRFRTERQILASLEHPNIARLLDGGTTERGEPYLVMEYVEGESLIEYCDRRGASVEDRLRLFRAICAAVRYAHQNLVVHRDIKPSNILITAEGVPKLLDFGIAKLLSPEGETATADQTATLLRILTPDYASPEQVRGEPVTTATDVYSLGVVLYELLAGKKPYHVEASDMGDLFRVVCERDPEKPSTARISGESPASEEKTVTARRLRGDLDAIVMKAMRKERKSRYGSVEQLDEDIRRHLEGLPVLARRGTLSYRTAKFARRNRLLLAAAALLLMVLSGGVLATLREAERARTAEARAKRRFDDVRKLANSFLFEFHDAIRELPGSTPARALVVRRALEYLDDLSREASGDRSLATELSEAYQKVGDVEGNPFHQNLGNLKGAIADYDKAIALLEPIVASGRASDAEQSALANAYVVGGGIRVVAGDPKAAVTMAGKGLALRQGLADRHPGDARRASDLAQAFRIYAFNLSAAGRWAESYQALLRQAEVLRRLLAISPGDRQLRKELGQNLYLTGEGLRFRGEPSALKTLEEAAMVEEGLLKEDPASVPLRRDLGWTCLSMGKVHQERQDPRAAVAQYQTGLTLFEWIVAADPKNTDGRLGVGMMHHNLGVARRTLDGPTVALDDFDRAEASYEPVLKADPSNALVGGLLAELHFQVGEAEEAQGKSLDPSTRRERFEKACRSYSLASEGFERLKAAGRLQRDREESAVGAERAFKRCVDAGAASDRR